MNQIFPITSAPPPPKTIPNHKKDRLYDAAMGRFCMSASDSEVINEFRTEAYWNSRFYVGGGKNVFNKEDVDSFLRDESGNFRNRVLMTSNIFRPVMEQFRGNSERMDFNAIAKSVTHRVKSRKDAAREELLLAQRTADSIGSLRDVISSEYSIGENESQALATFENFWTDPLTGAINELLPVLAEITGMDTMRGLDAQMLAESGAIISAPIMHGQFYRWEIIHWDDFFWDTSDRIHRDLRRSDWMGINPYRSLSEIAERWNPGQETLNIIDSAIQAKMGFSNGTSSGSYDHSSILSPKVRVASVYWRDIQYMTHAYVKDKDGTISLKPIDWVDMDAPEGTMPEFTEKDIVPPPQTIIVQKTFKGRDRVNTAVELVRYCDFIPWEYLHGSGPVIEDQVKAKKIGDIVLDSGVFPLQQQDHFDTSLAALPIKVELWANVAGKPIAPMSDLRDPQRMINRILTVQEKYISNASGANVVVDMDAFVDSGMKEIDVRNAIAEGRPLTGRFRGRGMQNAVLPYDATPRQGVYALSELIRAIEGYSNKATGVHEPMKGEPTGELLGVTEILTQRGALIQEPFYAAIMRWKLQMYQFNATAGKDWVIQHPDVMEDLISEDKLAPLQMSADASLDRFRVFIKRENMDEIRRKAADNLLMNLKQFGMLDDVRIADLFGRAYTEDVAKAMREYQGELIEAKKMEAKQQEIAAKYNEIKAEDDKLADKEAMLEQESIHAGNMEADRQAKTMAPVVRSQADAMFGK